MNVQSIHANGFMQAKLAYQRCQAKVVYLGNYFK
jgi:hypothetical protein